MSASNRIDQVLDEVFSTEETFRGNMKAFHDAVIDSIHVYGIDKFSEDEKKILTRLESTLAGLSEDPLGADPALSQEDYQIRKHARDKRLSKVEEPIKPIKIEEPSLESLIKQEIERRKKNQLEPLLKQEIERRENRKQALELQQQELKELKLQAEIRNKRISAFQKFLGDKFVIQQTLFSTASVEFETFNIFLASMKKNHPEFYNEILGRYQKYFDTRFKGTDRKYPIAEGQENELQSLTIMPIQRGPRYADLLGAIAKHTQDDDELNLSQTLEKVRNNLNQMNTAQRMKTGYTTAQALINRLLFDLNTLKKNVKGLKENEKYANNSQIEKVSNQLQQLSYDIALKRNVDYENILQTLQTSVKKLEPVLNKKDFIAATNAVENSELKNFVISNQWKNLYDAVTHTINECEKHYSKKLEQKPNDERAQQITKLLANLKPGLAKLNPEPDISKMSEKDRDNAISKRYQVPDAASYNKMIHIIDALHTARSAYGPLFNIHEDRFSSEVGHLLKEQNSAANLLISKNGPLLSKHETHEVRQKKTPASSIQKAHEEEGGDKGKERPHGP